jgi:ATP-dependent RNA helicase DeaD
MTFSELGLREELLKAVSDLGFETPTPIQEKSIPVLVSGTKDFIGLASTGTGKTAAFGLPLLSLINPNAREAEALIICPTRELCMQIVKDLVKFKQYLPDCFITAVYGGASISMQIRDIKKGVCIVVATPGRLIDLIERKAINLSSIQYVVLDEADEMLNMGFQDDIEFILGNTPNRNATWLFSATMPNEIKRVSRKYMNEPAEVTVNPANSTNTMIDHQYYATSERYRYETLKRLIDFNPGIYGIIFTRTKADADEIAEKLTRDGYDIDALHGDLSQQQRDKVMNAFRRKELQLLIATDVAARGIDVQGISHVINYQLPDDIEVYTHRSGRTGRAGNTGICMSIIAPKEVGKMRGIERISKAKFNKSEIPTGNDVCRKQFMKFMDKIHNADISAETYTTYMPMLLERFADMSREEILQRVAALEFDRFVKYYENAIDLNQRAPEGRDRDRGNDRGDRNDRGSDRGSDRGRDREGSTRNASVVSNARFSKYFINLGSKDNFDKKSLIHHIAEIGDTDAGNIGNVFIQDTFSFVEIDKSVGDTVANSIDSQSFQGRKIRMNESESGGSGRSSEEGGRSSRSRSFGNSDRSSGGERRSYGGGERSGGGDRGGSRGGDRGGSSYGDRGGSRGGSSRDNSGSSRGGSSYGGGSRGGSSRDGDAPKRTYGSSQRSTGSSDTPLRSRKPRD